MKKALYVLIAVGVGAGLIWLGWAMRGGVTKASPPHASLASAGPGNPHPAQVGRTGMLALSEWQEFRTARETALQSNPELAAEYKDLIQELQDQQNKLDAAMIKADPTVAPIIAKLVVLRQHNGTPNSSLPIR